VNASKPKTFGCHSTQPHLDHDSQTHPCSQLLCVCHWHKTGNHSTLAASQRARRHSSVCWMSEWMSEPMYKSSNGNNFRNLKKNQDRDTKFQFYNLLFWRWVAQRLNITKPYAWEWKVARTRTWFVHWFITWYQVLNQCSLNEWMFLKFVNLMTSWNFFAELCLYIATCCCYFIHLTNPLFRDIVNWTLKSLSRISSKFYDHGSFLTIPFLFPFSHSLQQRPAGIISQSFPDPEWMEVESRLWTLACPRVHSNCPSQVHFPLKRVVPPVLSFNSASLYAGSS
jgi:hypothetical protein